MGDKLIRYIFEQKGAKVILDSMLALEKSGLGLATANKQVERTTKLTDGTMLHLKGTFDSTGIKLKDVTYGVKQLSSAFSKAHPYLAQYQKALMRVAIVVPVWMAARVAIRAFTETVRAGFRYVMDLSDGLARAAVVSHGSAESIKAALTILGDKAAEFARNNKGSLKDVTEAYYQMGTAGIETNLALAASVQTAKLANATYSDVVSAGKTVSGVYTVLGDTIQGTATEEEKMTVITDTLATMWRNHRVELSQVQQSMANAGSQSKRFGLTMQETMGIIAVSSDNLIQSGRAGRLFARTMDDMSSKLPLIEQLLGKTFDKNKPLNWFGVFKDVIAKFKELNLSTPDTLKQFNAIFGIRARNQVGVFIKDMDKVTMSIDRLTEGSKGAVDNIMSTLNATPAAQLQIFNEQIAQLVGNFAMGITSTDDFVSAMVKINTTLDGMQTSAIAAGATLRQFFINLTAAKEVFYLQTSKKHSLAKAIMGDEITFAEAKAQLDALMNEALIGVADLGTAGDKALAERAKRLAEAKALLEKTGKSSTTNTNNNNPGNVLPTEKDLARRLAIMTAIGASSLQIAKERVRYMQEEMHIVANNEQLLDAINKQEEERLKLVSAYSKQIRGSLKDAFSESFTTGDFGNFFETFKEGLRKTIIDAMAESATNAVLNVSGLDQILGQTLETIHIERAFDDGALTVAAAIDKSFVKGAQLISEANAGSILGAKAGDSSTGLAAKIADSVVEGNQRSTWIKAGSSSGKVPEGIRESFPGIQESVPIAPNDAWLKGQPAESGSAWIKAGSSSGKVPEYIRDEFPKIQESVPIGASNAWIKGQPQRVSFVDTKLAEMDAAKSAQPSSGFFDFLKNDKFKSGLGVALLGASLFGSGKSKNATSNAFSTAPGNSNGTGSTRSSVKAVVTNITVAPVFNLPAGIGAESANLIKEVEGKITPLIRDITQRILEDENIASGNV